MSKLRKCKYPVVHFVIENLNIQNTNNVSTDIQKRTKNHIVSMKMLHR